MSMFLLAISCLTTWQFTLIHESNIPGSYAVLLFTALDFTSITSLIHNWVLFFSWLCLFILSGVIFPLFFCSIWSTYRLESSSFRVISFCLLILFMGSKGKNMEVVCKYFLLQWTTFCQNSPPWPIHHGWPIQGMAHSFIELDKAVVHVVSLISFLWLWFSFCLSYETHVYFDLLFSNFSGPGLCTVA